MIFIMMMKTIEAQAVLVCKARPVRPLLSNSASLSWVSSETNGSRILVSAEWF